MTDHPSRRRFLHGAAAGASLAALSPLIPAWAQSARPLDAGLPGLSGTEFDLQVARTSHRVNGRRGGAVTVNGTVPAPLLRWREGDEVTLRVTNRLEEDTSIHWHGLLLPFTMDGVPGVSFPGILPGETFTYRFPVRQAGTYWYHSHSGLQEQAGHYGAIVIDPAGADPVAYDREYVLVLSDWIFGDSHRLFGELKKNGESLNFSKRTVGDFVRDAREDGLGATISDRLMWGRMRMAPNDIADVSGVHYRYLINGHGFDDNWTALFRPGERVRLRIVNASAMTIYDLRIPGLEMEVVQADGLNVAPVPVDELQIGVAETYDVAVTPKDGRAYAVVAESIDRTGMARATLAPRPGMAAPVPPLRPKPLLTMKDMGMAHHGGHGGHGGHGATDHGATDHGGTDHGAMDHGAMDHAAMGHGTMDRGAMDRGAPMGLADVVHDHARGPGVANVAEEPSVRVGEPGIGLEGMAHRVLTYAQLKSLAPNPDRRRPGREMEIHLTGNMERYMWSFDGVKFSAITAPIVFREGERLRVTLVNDTMMSHPIHLHGMFFELVDPGYDAYGDPAGPHMPRKHTVIVKPGEKLAFDVTADAPGDWAFHCHLLYHMHAGMMQVVSVRPPHEAGDAA